MVFGSFIELTWVVFVTYAYFPSFRQIKQSFLCNFNELRFIVQIDTKAKICIHVHKQLQASSQGHYMNYHYMRTKWHCHASQFKVSISYG